MIQGDALEILKHMDKRFDLCITSPPYFQKFDYELDGQYGLEPTVQDYLTVQMRVFNEINRLLVEGGTCWIVIGDTSNNYSPVRARHQRKGSHGEWKFRRRLQDSYLEKETLSVPFRFAQAMRDSGWVHRASLIWDKHGGSTVKRSDTAPETHEYILQFIKWSKQTRPYGNTKPLQRSVLAHPPASHPRHGAVFPQSLVRELLSVAPEQARVIDPYVGSGTTMHVCFDLGLECTGIDLDISDAVVMPKATV